MPSNLENLREWLKQLKPGPIPTSAPFQVEHLLQLAWGELKGSDDQSTTSDKLAGRVEDPSWEPPVLTFVIERHGGTVNGSSRAELHQWTVDVECGRAQCNANYSHRQIRKADARFDVGPHAQEIANKIARQTDDPRLAWDADKKIVMVKVGDFIDGRNKQTIAGRRKRFRSVLEPILAEGGWIPAVGKRPNTYTRK